MQGPWLQAGAQSSSRSRGHGVQGPRADRSRGARGASARALQHVSGCVRNRWRALEPDPATRRAHLVRCTLSALASARTRACNASLRYCRSRDAGTQRYRGTEVSTTPAAGNETCPVCWISAGALTGRAGRPVAVGWVCGPSYGATSCELAAFVCAGARAPASRPLARAGQFHEQGCAAPRSTCSFSLSTFSAYWPTGTPCSCPRPTPGPFRFRPLPPCWRARVRHQVLDPAMSCVFVLAKQLASCKQAMQAKANGIGEPGQSAEGRAPAA